MNYKINNAFSISGKMIWNTHFRLYSFLTVHTAYNSITSESCLHSNKYNMLVSGRETFIKCRFGEVI